MFLQHRDQVAAGFWNSNSSAQDDLFRCEFAAVNIRGSVVIRTKSGTFERNARKKTA